jgi:hypothetical protein
MNAMKNSAQQRFINQGVAQDFHVGMRFKESDAPTYLRVCMQKFLDSPNRHLRVVAQKAQARSHTL